MKSKLYLISLLLLWVLVRPVGATVNTLSVCDHDTVQTAITNAVDGDTIQLPPINCPAWSQAVALTKGIIFLGAGTTHTTISGSASPFISLTLSADKPVRVSGIYFNSLTNSGSDKYAIKVFGRNQDGNGTALTKVRIDHNRFDSGKRQIYTSGYVYGVIDHNYFYCDNISIYLEGDGNPAWKRPIVPGTINAMFIEDNNFISDEAHFPADGNNNQDIYHQYGSRSVIRYNQFSSTVTSGNPPGTEFIDSHGNMGWYLGNDHNEQRGQPMIEIYNNTFHATKSDEIGDSRGGSVIMHDNTITIDVGSTRLFQLVEEEAFYCPPYSSSTLFCPLRENIPNPISGSTWPAEDQVFANFFWNNTLYLNGSTTGRLATSSDVQNDHNHNEPAYIQLNRDYWMSQPSASTCTTYPQVVNISYSTGTPTGAVQYPMPDATHGYPCVTSYTPYTHPHPLVTQTSNSSPASPKNFRATGN